MNTRKKQIIWIRVFYGLPGIVFAVLAMLNSGNGSFIPLMLLALGGQQLTIFLTGRKSLPELQGPGLESFLFSSVFLFTVAGLLLVVTTVFVL